MERLSPGLRYQTKLLHKLRFVVATMALEEAAAGALDEAALGLRTQGALELLTADHGIVALELPDEQLMERYRVMAGLIRKSKAGGEAASPIVRMPMPGEDSNAQQRFLDAVRATAQARAAVDDMTIVIQPADDSPESIEVVSMLAGDPEAKNALARMLLDKLFNDQKS